MTDYEVTDAGLVFNKTDEDTEKLPHVPVPPADTETVPVVDAAEQAPIDPAKFWAEQYKEATAGAGGNFLFFKADRTRVRLIGIGSDLHNYFRQVENVYRGKKSNKYLVLGYELKPDVPVEELELQAIVFSKGAWGDLCAFMMEKYDFFTPDGVGLVISRKTVGSRISYVVMPGPVKVPVPEHIITAAKEADWDVYVEAYRLMQEANSENNSSADTASIADQIVNATVSPNAW